MSKAWVVKALWIGPELSLIEQLAIKSFLANGHEVHLFTYEKTKNIPEGTIVRDGNEILSKDKIYKYKNRPSYSGFANWFRYAMLYKEGGVWIDTDVVCLKKMDFDSDIFFGLEQFDKVNCAVVGSEPENELFRFLSKQVENPNDFLPYDSKKDKKKKLKRKYLQGNQRGNVRWGETGPVGFTKALEHFGLLDHALPTTAFYPIHAMCWTAIFDETYSSVERYFPDSYAIHLWNEMMRRVPGFDKNSQFPKNSLIENLKKRYL